MCQAPPPHHANISGGKRLAQPICFFTQICSQFGNVIYKYRFCSQGSTLTCVRPDGSVQHWARVPPRRWQEGPVWPAESPADTHHCLGGQLRGGQVQGWCPGIPSYRVKEWQGPKLSKHMAVWPKTEPWEQIFLSSVLAWRFEAEPEPATHFSNLILCTSST